MVKDENNVWTGKISPPKGMKFYLKIVKSTVSTTSGGNNTWSAIMYSSTLNKSTSYDFGEFTDNLIPNGNFEGGQVKWTPANCIVTRDYAISGGYFLAIGDNHPNSATSDTFVIQPNQDLRISGYMYSWDLDGASVIEVKDVDTQSVLFKTVLSAKKIEAWEVFSGEFKTGSLPVTVQVVCTSVGRDAHGLDNLSLITP